MGFLYSILVGGVAGCIATRIMENHNTWHINVVLGVIGGFFWIYCQ